jgi:ferredoxin-NADP reductase
VTGVLRLRVERKTALADGVAGLTLVPASGGELPEWTPGAHVDLHLPCGLTRQYSLCGDPADRGHWQVAVLREPAGRGGSACVHDDLTPGDELDAAGPRNNFPLVDADGYLFIAGGIGITPILPMLAQASRAGRPWRLAYGGRTRASMAFLPELAAHGGQAAAPPRAGHGGRVTVWPQDERGLLPLDDLLAAPGPGAAVYCCGPEPLLRAVEDRCAPGIVHLERFAPKQPAEAEAEQTPFEVELASCGRVVEVPAGVSVLSALRGAGLEVLSSCEEGTCGTCETGVLDGVPDHRDSVLTPAERDVCDIMMICVSRARSQRLVLDL